VAESDFEAWKEIRGRVDSIASALFLVAGGALSVSIAVLLGKDHPAISAATKCLVSLSWYFLLSSIIAFLLVKAGLVVQAYKMIYVHAPRKDVWHSVTTWANWILGILGLITFGLGMLLLVVGATSVL